MKKFILYIIVLTMHVFLYSCGNSSSEIIKLIAERDSLRTMSNNQADRIKNYEQTVSLLNSTLDSIAYEEQMIFVNIDNREVPVTKDVVRQNLLRYESILKQQSDRIKELENKLKASNDSTSHSLQLIAHLREQIEVKNAQISQLKQELEKKNVDIARLQEQVESQRSIIVSQTSTINELNERTQKQNEALAKQDAILNNGYILIATKSELIKKGIINKKGKLNSDTVLDRSIFKKINIRNQTEFSFTAKKPRILTNMPPSSYELTTDGNKNFTLRILNPSDFWKISSYLVIQKD